MTVDSSHTDRLIGQCVPLGKYRFSKDIPITFHKLLISFDIVVIILTIDVFYSG